MLAAAKADGVALSTNECYRELSGQVSVAAVLDGPWQQRLCGHGQHVAERQTDWHFDARLGQSG